MSLLTPPFSLPPPSVPTVPVLPLTVDQYHAMVAAGILTEDHAVELLAGLLVPKMPKNPRHRTATRLLRTELEALLPAGWYVDSQEPITLSDSEPEPDISVVRGETRDYANRHPAATDLALVAEIADASLDRDRGLKLRVYASAGVAVYWIVNLVDQQVEQHTQPTGAGDAARYVDRQDYRRGDEVPVFIDGREVGRIAVTKLLP